MRPGAFYSEHFANKTVSEYQNSVDVLPAAQAASGAEARPHAAASSGCTPPESLIA
ncbi:hypothetical protein GCM10010245_59760 [Streptomyces spectabilis]|nr:hypothetical protein GCM10010245_59760 [Streptomyces spectabilis]